MHAVFRQAFRVGTHYSACCRFSRLLRVLTNEVMREPSSTAGIITLRHGRRLVHDDCGADDRKELGKLEGKMKLMFTCKKCQTRNSKLISKLAYNKGVVIVRCDGCKNNHLIADNLGWFPEFHKGINVEKLMAQKGESVRKIINDMDGYFEAVTREKFDLRHKEANATRDSSSNEPAKIDKIGVSKESR